jgi:hypothetical protein
LFAVFVARILRTAPALLALNVTLEPSFRGSVENRIFNVNFARLVTLERSAHDQSKQWTLVLDHGLSLWAGSAMLH